MALFFVWAVDLDRNINRIVLAWLNAGIAYDLGLLIVRVIPICIQIPILNVEEILRLKENSPFRHLRAAEEPENISH